MMTVEAPTQEKALEWLNIYAEGRETKSTGETAMKYAVKPLKLWLELNGDLVDGETGWRAELRSGKANQWADLVTMAKDHPDLLIWAAQQGLLSLATKNWNARKGDPEENVGKFKGFVHQGEGSPSLKLTKEE